MLAASPAIYILDQLTERVTRVTQVAMIDLKIGGGHIGTMISYLASKYLLALLDDLHTKYERKGGDVDSELRREFVDKIGTAPALSVTSEFLIQECKDLMKDYDSPNGIPETTLKKPSHSGEMAMKRKQNRGWCERSIATGRCSDIIDASPAETLAYLYDFCSRQRMVIHTEQGHVARLNVTDDGRQQLIAAVKRVQWPLKNREFVCKVMWWNDVSGAYYLGVASVSNDIDYGTSLYTVRGFTKGLVKLEPFGDVGEDGRFGQCRMIYTQKLDGAGDLPAFVVNSSVPMSLNLVKDSFLEMA